MNPVGPEGVSSAGPRSRRSWRMPPLVVAGLLLGASAAEAQQITVNPRYGSVQDKAPLAWRQGDVSYLLNMAELPRAPGGDWAIQPTMSASWGRPVEGSPTGWSTTRPDGTPMGKIYAFGGAGPTDGTETVDWGDGSLLRASAAAAFRYNIPEGTIFYSTRLNTSSPARPKGAGADPGYGTRYRIMVYMSKDDARTWTLLPPVALSAKGPGDDGSMVGLWSNFLFERDDGTIQIYYDNQLAPWQEPGGRSRREQWVAMQSLVPGPSLAWTGQQAEIIVDGNQPGRPRPNAGMATVSRKSPGDGTMFVTLEDVDYYGVPGEQEPRFQLVIRVMKSADGGRSWMYVNTLRQPRGFNNMAPYHVRSRITGELIVVFRSDARRMGDPANPMYDPYVSAKQGSQTGNPRWLLGNIHVLRSGDDGATWQPLEQAPGSPYRPGDDESSFEPGVTELRLSPTSSNLVFQWGQFLGGLNPPAAGPPAKLWVQTVTIRK